MNKVPVIVGPTGIGKTEVSLRLAENFPIEIISADSRQIYKFLDIGTAKPKPGILEKITHHFIDQLSPVETYSAGVFGRDARDLIHRLLKESKLPVVVGGSGFYIQALIDGLSEIDSVDPSIREQLQNRLNKEGIERLHDELSSVDPFLAEKTKNSDKQRVLRGLEVYYSLGIPLSQIQSQKPIPADFRFIMIGLNSRRELLYEKINKRVDQMIEMGLVNEVRGLKELGYTEELNALNTVGYKEVFEHLKGNFDFDTMVEKIKMHTRRYAKRQLTWFKRDKRIRWFNLDDYEDSENLITTIIEYIKSN